MAGISNKFAIYITGGRILSMAAGFIMPVVLVRMMSQEDYGLTSQFFTLYTSIYSIAAMGIHTTIFYFCSSVSKTQADKYITNTLLLLFIFSVVCGTILFLPPVNNILFGDSELGKHSDLIILSIALATVMNMVSPLSTVREDKWGALLFPGFIAFGRIVAIIYTALVFKDVHQMFYWLLIFQFVITLLIVLYTKHNTSLKVDFCMMKEQLLYSLPFGFAVALQLLSNYFDKLVCIRYLTTTEYAIYSVAFLSIPGIMQIYESLCQVNIVNMSNCYRSGRNNEILPLYGNFVIKVLSFSVPIILVVALYSEEIVEFLYTDSYILSAPYFRLYTLTSFASILGAGTILRSMGKTKEAMFAFVLTCFIGLPSTYVLILNYGTSGAIWGSVINIMLPRFIQIAMEVHATKSDLHNYLPWKKIAIIFFNSIVFLLPLILVKCIWHFSIWFCMTQSVIYLFIIYSILIYKSLFIVDGVMVRNKIKKFWRN